MPTTLTHKSPTLTDLLSQLIRMPTVTGDQAANATTLDWISEQLAGLPLEIKQFVNKGFPALVATTPAVTNKNPRLWLAGHIDVVPGSSQDFSPHIQDGRLIGRGAFDMKYAVAAFIKLLQQLGPDLTNYDLGLMLSADEEFGGEDGIQWLLSDQGYAGQAVLLPECGTAWTIETGAKGSTKWRLRSRGQASHASRPWNGVNAIDQLTDYVAQLKTNVPTEPCGDENHAHSTINLGQITGGNVANQVPNFAEALLDIRLTEEVSLDDLTQWFTAASAVTPHVEAEFMAGTGATTNIVAAVTDDFCRITHEVTGIQPQPMRSHGSSDARFFTKKQIPVITVPPVGGGQHTDYEWIDLASYKQYFEIMQRFTTEWAGPDRSPRPAATTQTL